MAIFTYYGALSFLFNFRLVFLWVLRKTQFIFVSLDQIEHSLAHDVSTLNDHS